MNNHKGIRQIGLVVVPFLFACASLAQSQAQPEGIQQIEKMQQAVAANRQQLRGYQWIETTKLTTDGKLSRSQQSTCKYAPDGTVQKTSLGQEEASSGRKGGPFIGGMIRRAAAKKKEDNIKDEIAQLRALAGMYAPLDPEKFMKSLEAGQVTSEAAGANDITVTINNYANQGDQLRLTLNNSSMLIERIAVKTYLDTPKEAVDGNVQFSALDGGTMYPGAISINVPSKKVSISISRSDFTRMAN